MLAWGEPKQYSERLLNRLAAGLWYTFSLGCSHVWKSSHHSRDSPVVLCLCSPLFLSRVQVVSCVRFIYLPPPCWENPPGFLGSRRREGSGGLKLCLHAEYSTARLETCSLVLCLRVTVRLTPPEGAAKCPVDVTPAVVLHPAP